MDVQNEKIRIKARISLFLLAFIMHGFGLFAAELKLADASLDKVIELYSAATHMNVFVDERVQKKRKVTVHLQDMPIEKAFDIIKKTMGLESQTVGTNTLLIYPPELSQRYAPNLKPVILRTPKGIDPKWVVGILRVLLPKLRVAQGTTNKRVLILFGTNNQVNKARKISNNFPEIAVNTENMMMSDDSAKLAATVLKNENVTIKTAPGMIEWSGSKSEVRKFKKKLTNWVNTTRWTNKIYRLISLDIKEALSIAKSLKTKAKLSDLGGTGSVLVEGPCVDVDRLINILKSLEQQMKIEHREITLGETKPEVAKAAIKASGLKLKVVGDKNLVLIGTSEALDQGETILKSLDRKRKQVLIKLKLAEVSKSKLKQLGIELDKSVYGYSEIKKFHADDALPLLLKALDEGTDSRMLAAPNLRVIEGEEAKVTIGDRIPLEVSVSAQTDSGSNLKLNTQLSWVDVGIKMTLKDVKVRADGSIKINVKGEVSSVIATTKQGYPQIRTREVETILRVKNGGSVVMGGLLNREQRKVHRRIPIISRIPLFGGLGRSRDKQKRDTEIIMIVTAETVED